jgi:peptidoglycan/LPS O-acetylase OafA/YrhL
LQLKYRADIDGLRAIAVISVVVFHVSQSILNGGFVGVDVFFVISGYLITLGILEGLEKGTFTLGGFYANRCRRIAPAYIVLLAVVTVFVGFLAYPAETKGYGWSLLAAIFSVSNIYFWLTTNYFALAAEELPLLHTWSLAVEEQFYLNFPMILAFALKRGRRTALLVVAGIFLASLAASALLVRIWPAGTFYTLPTRAWELLVGSLLGMECRWRASHGLRPTPAVASLIAFAGLLCMAYAIYFFNSTMAFPGLVAALPCLGAGAVIYAGSVEVTPISRLLSVAPMRFVGKISYSLYLWHWPILVIQKISPFIPGSDSRIVARGGVIALSFIAAAMSWRFIEKPTRDRARVPTSFLVRGAFASAAAICIGGFIMTASGGLPGRYSRQVLAVARYLDYDEVAQFRVGTCFLTRDFDESAYDLKGCLRDDAGKQNIVVVGDSHAAALSYGLRKAFPDSNILQVTGVGCPPLVVSQPNPPSYCRRLLDIAFRQLPEQRKIAAIWLIARWNLGRDGAAPGWNADWLDNLSQTIKTLRAHNVPIKLIGPMPEYSTELPRLIAREYETLGRKKPASSITGSSLRLDDIMANFARREGVAYVSLREALCPDAHCSTRVDDAPLLFDTDHLTDRGSEFVAERIRERLQSTTASLTPPLTKPALAGGSSTGAMP